MEDANLTEKHLKEAYSMARENEMIQEERASEECTNYKDLGLPSGIHQFLLDYVCCVQI